MTKQLLLLIIAFFALSCNISNKENAGKVENRAGEYYIHIKTYDNYTDSEIIEIDTVTADSDIDAYKKGCERFEMVKGIYQRLENARTIAKAPMCFWITDISQQRINLESSIMDSVYKFYTFDDIKASEQYWCKQD